jgi:hypothetical protein
MGFRRWLSNPGWKWAVAGLALAMLAFSAWVTISRCDQPLVDIHAFRQTQTALTADWMFREGWRFDYQTPFAGAPWSIPFEFPIYQSIVASIVAVTGCNLSATGRIVSWLFLAACAWPAFAVAKRLRLSQNVPCTFCSLLWSAPLYVYWGRTFMIETAALFFTLASLPWWFDVVRGRNGVQARLLLLGYGSVAVLQKSTTAGPVLLLLLMVSMARAILAPRRQPSRQADAVWAVAILLASLAIGAAWVAHTDAVKEANALGRTLTTSGLSAWNFGLLAQKLDPETWRMVVWQRGFVWNAAGLLGLTVLAGPWIVPENGSFHRRRRERSLVLASLSLFLMPILIFTNVHVVHEYYQVACVAFLLAALAVVIGDWLPRISGLTASTPLLLVAFLISNIAVYRSYYGIVVGRLIDEQDPVSLGRYRLGLWLRNATPEGAGLVVFGQDYSSELPFHAGRKAFVCPSWFGDSRAVWEQPENSLDGLPLGAIIISPQPGQLPTHEQIRKRAAGGGWRHEFVEGCDVLLPTSAPLGSSPPNDPQILVIPPQPFVEDGDLRPTGEALYPFADVGRRHCHQTVLIGRQVELLAFRLKPVSLSIEGRIAEVAQTLIPMGREDQ